MSCAGYAFLHPCLQLRQNPPTCASGIRTLSFRVAANSAIGFRSPGISRRIASTIRDHFTLWRLCVGDLRVYRVLESRSATRVQLPPFVSQRIVAAPLL